MDMNFDPKKIFQQRLAISMGLDKYQYIMERMHNTDISADADFQRIFNSFYVVRRNEVWRKVYYEHFEKMKTGIPTFGSILTHMYERTGNIEPSFSSKMLASIFPEKPIWDRYVIQNLELKLVGATQQEKLWNAIALYQEIEEWYRCFLKSEKAKQCVEEFDSILPDYKNLSSVKKIDSILWSIR